MSMPVQTVATPPGRTWWRALAYAISLAALAWVVVLWWKQWPTVIDRISEGDGWGLAAGLLMAIASGYANFVAFAILVRSLIGNSLRLSELSHLYFVAQLLKHLPGRIWGIGYQAAAGKNEGGPSRWIVANLAHMAAASYVALTMAIAVVAWGSAPLASIALSALAAIAFFMVHPACRRLEVRFLSRRGWFARAGSLLSLFRIDQSSWLKVLIAFIVAGLLHYGSWVMYARVIGLEELDAALVLCAIYMLAWFAGYVAFLTPSGIGVRELAFLALASGFDADVVAVMAVFGRASFLAVDVLISLPFLARTPKG